MVYLLFINDYCHLLFQLMYFVGLGFRPMSPNVEDGSLIYYEAGNSTNVQAWTNELDKFLAGQ